MSIANLFENPPLTSLAVAILGTLATQGLRVADMLVIGRVIIYLGEAIVTVATLQSALETAEANKNDQKTADNPDMQLTMDDILELIKQLQRQNQQLQEQIWDLQNCR
ncbi:hypothetical protein [Sporomusa acidovorans]|uniref:Uncharacterized protein n=1 Tax=Sporomusa acidovorans (strain ATCC 49682 / DSM 3132 / Mol) TaxID=1123286 RepID=A0ABZ3IZU8_SPOA4|nr:hypothetical protein [Sporomusa acidovorans]OZC18302.1 hypothetical protein SPACI_34640 [Sporomusa acidovorans DSM 3132]SDF20582.1 hypothetical protein SAMN04488499_103745 [Sporomusa acidovorans]